MAGSLNHIVAPDGTFTMDCIENMGDAREALEECHQIIAELLECMTLVEGHDPGRDFGLNVRGIPLSDKAGLLKMVCDRLGFPTLQYDDGVISPVIQRDLLGFDSVYKKTPDQPAEEWLVWDVGQLAWLGARIGTSLPEKRVASMQIESAERFSMTEAKSWRALDEHRYIALPLRALV